MSYPYTYPVHCALCQEVIPVSEIEWGEAVEDDNGSFCNSECQDMWKEQKEKEDEE